MLTILLSKSNTFPFSSTVNFPFALKNLTTAAFSTCGRPVLAGINVPAANECNKVTKMVNVNKRNTCKKNE